MITIPFTCNNAQTMSKNYYETLQITKHATISEIKKAYRVLAFQYRPDKNNHPEAQAIFVSITEAYEVLKDPLKKATNDTYIINDALVANYAETHDAFRLLVLKRQTNIVTYPIIHLYKKPLAESKELPK